MKELSAKVLGLRVAYYRKLHNLTQIQLAERADISVRYVSLIETGHIKNYPSIPVLGRICEVLNISMSILFSEPFTFISNKEPE